jgi:hypothetical protein
LQLFNSYSEGRCHLVWETPLGTLMTLGLIGSGLVDANVLHDFAWDGTAISFADGQPGMLALWLDVADNQQRVLSIPGLLDVPGGENLSATLVFGAGAAVANLAVVTFGEVPSTMSTAEIITAAPGATFRPVYWEYGSDPEPTLVSGNPIVIPATGLELTSSYMPAGNYYLMTSLTDIWGNQGTELDLVNLTEPLSP